MPVFEQINVKFREQMGQCYYGCYFPFGIKKKLDFQDFSKKINISLILNYSFMLETVE